MSESFTLIHFFNIRECKSGNSPTRDAITQIEQTLKRLLKVKPGARIGKLEVVFSRKSTRDGKTILDERSQLKISIRTIPIPFARLDRHGFVLPSQ
jgi:hypothetical protein